MKACKQCKISKELSFFYGDKRNKDGLRVKCKDCVKAQDKISRKKHVARNLANKRKWYQNNKDHYKERGKREWIRRKHILIPLFAKLHEENYPYQKYRMKLERMAAKEIEAYRYQKKANEDHDLKHGIVWGGS